MNEVDDKIDYEPGVPEALSFLKALCFLMASGLTLLGGGMGGLIGLVLLASLISSPNPASTNLVGAFASLSLIGGAIAACWLIPKIRR